MDCDHYVSCKKQSCGKLPSRYLCLSVLSLAVLGQVLISCGCDRERTGKTDLNEMDPVESVKAMDSEEIERFEELLATISVGNTYEGVIEVLGRPTQDDDYAAKERPEIIGKRVRYIIEQKHPRLLNAKTDRYATFYFGTDGLLDKIVKNNIGE